MSCKTNYQANLELDFNFRGQSYVPPVTLYFGLIISSKGLRSNSTAYSLNDTIFITANDGKVHLYKCTTAGATAASQGTLYPGANNEAITDGTAVFTEQYSNFKANSGLTEASGGSYARVAVTSNLTNWAGTQGAGTTTVSSGTSGTTSNNVAITFPSPTANWNCAGYFGVWDASTAGNLRYFVPMTNTKFINNGDIAPTIPIAALTEQMDN